MSDSGRTIHEFSCRKCGVGETMTDSDLRLRIGEKFYLVTPNLNPVTTGHAWRLRLLDLSGKFACPTETVYDIGVMHGLATCDCPDAHWRKEPKRLACRHILAMVHEGLLPNNLPNTRGTPK